MSIDFHVVIPARYHSSRLPGKLLLDLKGQTVLERVYRQVQAASPRSITIATDHQAIATLAESLGAQVKITDSAHQSGTDRIAEVVREAPFADEDIIVNVQADEPFIAPRLIRQVATSLANSHAPVATLCWPITDEAMAMNPNVVKVVRNKYNQALYFSRSFIPFCRDNPTAVNGLFRHIGLYAYRRAFLQLFTDMPVCELEKKEALEQLRVLWAGFHVLVEEACEEPKQDINTAEDLEAARLLI